MYAVIKTGGKQYRVSPGDRLKVEKLNANAGETVTFSDVLMVGDGANVSAGAPTVSGAKVTATVVEHGRGKKVIVFRFKRRKGFQKKQGHRQDYTLVQIDEVEAEGEKAAAETEPALEKNEEKTESEAPETESGEVSEDTETEEE